MTNAAPLAQQRQQLISSSAGPPSSSCGAARASANLKEAAYAHRYLRPSGRAAWLRLRLMRACRVSACLINTLAFVCRWLWLHSGRGHKTTGVPCSLPRIRRHLVAWPGRGLVAASCGKTWMGVPFLRPPSSFSCMQALLDPIR